METKKNLVELEENTLGKLMAEAIKPPCHGETPGSATHSIIKHINSLLIQIGLKGKSLMGSNRFLKKKKKVRSRCPTESTQLEHASHFAQKGTHQEMQSNRSLKEDHHGRNLI